MTAKPPKQCTKCGTEKPQTDFYKSACSRDGLRSYCKACAKSLKAAWKAANSERVKAVNAAWYEANLEKVKATQDKYRAANRDKRKASDAAWYEANRDAVKETQCAYHAANPEVGRMANHNRRARKRASGGKLSKGLSDRLFKLQRGKCACGCKQPLGTGYHLDHIMPLALGGTNTDDNIQLLTATCNLQKNAKHPVDFMRQRGFLL